MTTTGDKPTFKTRLRNAFRRHYLLTLWLPLVITVTALFAAVLPYPYALTWISPSTFLLYAIGLAYLLVVSILRFCKKRIAPALVTLAALGLAVVAIAPALVTGFSLGVFGGPDRFADDLTIPAGIEVADPLQRLGSISSATPPIDPFQAAIRDALANTPNPPTTPPAPLKLAVPSLTELHQHHPALLRRYLAAHPAWRVHTHRGHDFATRRWMVNGHWIPDNNGYYSSFSDRDGPVFQTRTMLCLDGTPWSRGAQMIEPNIATTIETSDRYGRQESRITLRVAPGLLVGQFEQSPTVDRPITTTALAQLEAELAPLAADPTWQTARSLLPGSATTAQPAATIEIAEASQPGIFFSIARHNPGEPGQLYLKAFEVTRGDQLSETRLKTRSNEHAAWSDTPTEHFLSTTEFTIYEGDWGQPYAARLELWFQPASGSPERKLAEKIYKIEGWMH